MEDICKDCYAFANRHRYLANHTMGCNNDDGNGNINSNGDGDGNGNDNGNDEHSNDGRSNDHKNNDDSYDVSDVGVCPMRNIDFNCPEAASTKAREELLFQSVVHIKMARAQRAFYQAKVRCNCRERTLGKKIYFCC